MELSSSVLQALLNNKLIESIKNGSVEDVKNSIADGANVESIGEDSGLSASMLAASLGDVEKLDALKTAGADLSKIHESGHSVASLAAEGGHLSSLNYALANGASLDHLSSGLNAIKDPACRQSIISKLANQQSSVDMSEHQEKILKIADHNLTPQEMRPMSGFERIYALLIRAATHPVTEARISTWKKDRHEYTLKNAMELTQKYENNLAAYMQSVEMGKIMSDIYALGNNPNDVEYALRNTSVGKNLNIKDRLESISPEILMAIDREGKNVEAAWKEAVRSNSAAGNDITPLMEESMTRLAKSVETMPTKIKANGEVEFLGDKIKDQLEGLTAMAKALGIAITRLFSKK